MINIDTRLLDDVSIDQLGLLCHIIKRADNNLSCYPSNKTLCLDTGWNIKKLQKIKTELIDKGLLIVRPRIGKEEKQGSNWYSIRTDLMGVYVPAKNLSVLMQDLKVTLKTDSLSVPEKRTGPHTPKTDNKVLTNSEVLIDTESKDSVPQTALFEDEKEIVIEKGASVGQSDIDNIKKQKKSGPVAVNLVYAKCVEIWLKEIHPGWLFSAMHGKAIKSILEKVKTLTKNNGLEGTDAQIIANFRLMIDRLPAWYKDKDLPVINSKFNEIITEIQNGGRKQQNFNSRNSTDRFSDFAG